MFGTMFVYVCLYVPPYDCPCMLGKPKIMFTNIHADMLACIYVHTYIHTYIIHMQTALESAELLIVGDADGNQSLRT